MMINSQPAFSSSKLTIETLEQGVKYVNFEHAINAWVKPVVQNLSKDVELEKDFYLSIYVFIINNISCVINCFKVNLRFAGQSVLVLGL